MEDEPRRILYFHHILIRQAEGGCQGRANPRRANGRHGDAVRPQLDPESVEKTVDAGLAGAVAAHVRHAAIGSHARQRGDMAVLALTHTGKHCIQGVDDADEIDLNLGREVLARNDSAGVCDADAGAGDEQIDGSELRFQLRHVGAWRRDP